MTNQNKIGYIRVSTAKQNYDRQLDTIGQCHKVFSDKTSGKNFDRPGWKQLLGYVREGETVVVASIDRLGRNFTEFLNMVEQLREKGVSIHVVKEGLTIEADPNKENAMGKFMWQLFAMIAELERNHMLERQAEARQARLARGQESGRGRRVKKKHVQEIIYKHNEGVSQVRLAKKYKCSPRTIRRILDDPESYAGVKKEVSENS